MYLLTVLSIFGLLLVSSAQPVDEVKSYHGHSVLRVWPKTFVQLGVLRELQIDAPELSFWTEPSALGRNVDILVGPDSRQKLEKFLGEFNVESEVFIEDVEKAIQRQKQSLSRSPITREQDSHRIISDAILDNYQRLAKIYEFIEQQAVDYPSIVSTEIIGKSYEGRDIKIIKIGTNQEAGTKKIVWIDSGIHAREWITPASSLYFIIHLINGFLAGDAEITKLVETFEWHIEPVVNPDGYEYTHTTDRMWRKTRSPSNSPFGCKGADANRNFPFHWLDGGSSTNPCSETYAGASAGSEVEVQVMTAYLDKIKDRVLTYVGLHSYSQLWMFPWGWGNERPAEGPDLEKNAKVGVAALTAVHGTQYKIGTPPELLYIASGGAFDWALGVAGIKYSYTLELRDTGSNGFLLPPEQIRPTGEETWAGLRAMIEAIAPEFGIEI